MLEVSLSFNYVLLYYSQTLTVISRKLCFYLRFPHSSKTIRSTTASTFLLVISDTYGYNLNDNIYGKFKKDVL